MGVPLRDRFPFSVQSLVKALKGPNVLQKVLKTDRRLLGERVSVGRGPKVPVFNWPYWEGVCEGVCGNEADGQTDRQRPVAKTSERDVSYPSIRSSAFPS